MHTHQEVAEDRKPYQRDDLVGNEIANDLGREEGRQAVVPSHILMTGTRNPKKWTCPYIRTLKHTINTTNNVCISIVQLL